MAPAATKRALALSQSSQSPSQGSQARPKKRPRTLAPPAAPASTSEQPTTAAADQAQNPNRALPPAPQPAAEPASAEATSSKVSLPPPQKRTLHKGTLRRLSTGHPHGTTTNDTSITAASSSSSRPRPRTREKSTLSGAKIGGKSKDLKDRVEAEELWIRRPAKGSTRTRHGLGYAGYLKMGVAAFVERGCTTLTLHALGAAIPLCLSLALAIRDAIPGGEPLEDEHDTDKAAAGSEESVVKMEVMTGSKDVHDEITPDDEEEDIVYQTRTKSTVSITLSLSEPLRSSLGAATTTSGRTGGSSASRRGKKRSGRGR
ncbi:hypothetical protein JCM10908_007221 [Rhodotorula pacifica]|uniref:uncharacterized protein n=1 Tax=Rhodotorula pacifica TaxID=1495444 RepID=UPI0031730B0B